MVLENIISTKHYFQHKKKKKKKNITNLCYKIKNTKTLFPTRVKIQNPKHYFNSRKLLQISVTKFKTIDVILMCLEILLYKHKAVIKVPGIAKQTVNRK